MTAEEIKKLISDELKSETDLKNVFGLDLTKCLIEPTKQRYIDANDYTQEDYLWTVLEDSHDKNGYNIYFDDEANMFGLGNKSNKGEFINIGYYGTFLKTLYSM